MAYQTEVSDPWSTVPGIVGGFHAGLNPRPPALSPVFSSIGMVFMAFVSL